MLERQQERIAKASSKGKAKYRGHPPTVARQSEAGSPDSSIDGGIYRKFTARDRMRLLAETAEGAPLERFLPAPPEISDSESHRALRRPYRAMQFRTRHEAT
jgi:hypothetical protein